MALFGLLMAVCAAFVSCNARECSSDIIQPVSQVRYERISFTSSYACGFLWLSRCSRTRYMAVSREVYQLQTTGTNTECCDGYSRNGAGVCAAVCRSGCGPLQICQEPDVCVCIDNGYTGDNCNQPVCIDCASPRVCVAPGTCRCERGFTGPTCTDDINECEAMDNAGCEHVCTNHVGSFSCSCYEGFYLGSDRGRCVGGVTLTLATINSSSLLVEWQPPVWDTERLTTAYNITCSNGTSSVTTTVQNSANSETINPYSQTMKGIGTYGGYTCCAVVITRNGDGPPSCTVIPERVTTLPTTQTIEDASETGAAETGAAGMAESGEERIQDSKVFKVGVGAGAAGLVILLILVGIFICCGTVIHCRNRKAQGEMDVKITRTSTMDEHDYPNALYGLTTLKLQKQPLNPKSSDDDNGLEYNEVYRNEKPLDIEVSSSGEHSAGDLHYHYVQY